MDRSTSPPSHETRLAALERRLRMQTRWTKGLLVIVVLLAALGAGPGVFEEIKARRFVVSDENQNPRGILTSHNGATVLSLFDSAGAARARLAVQPNGNPELTLLDASGHSVATITESAGNVWMQMNPSREDGSLNAAGVQVFARTDKTGISLSDPSGQPGAVLSMMDHQKPVLLLQGNQKRTIVVPVESMPAQAASTGSPKR